MTSPSLSGLSCQRGGGSVLTKHHATVTETAAGLMIGGPSEYRQVGVFLKTYMCATQSDRTHTHTHTHTHSESKRERERERERESG